MRQALIFAALVLIPAAGAQTLPDKIESANEQVKQTQGPQPGCANCAADHAEDKTANWKKCIATLCPKGTGNLSQRILNWAAKNIDPATFLKLQSAQDMVNAAVRLQKTLDEFDLKMLKENPKISDPKIKNMIQFSKAVKNLGLLVVSRGEGAIDEAASKAKFKAAHLSDDDFKWGEALFKVIINLQKQHPPLFDETGKYGVARLAPSERKKQALDVLHIVTEQENKLAAQFGVRPKFLTGNEGELLANEIQSGDPSDAVLERLNERWSSAQLLADLLSDPNQLPKVKEGDESLIDLYGPEAEQKLKKRIQDETDYLNNKSSDLKAPMDEIVNTCQNAFVYAQALAPDKQQIEDFKTQEKKIRAEYIQRSKRLLSAQSWAALGKDSSLWGLRPIKDKDVLAADFMQWTQESIHNNEGEISDFADMKPNEVQFLAAITAVQATASVDELESFTEIKSLCTDKVPNVTQDFALPEQRMLAFSQTTATTPDRRMGAMFHEYSHQVSFLLAHSKDVSAKTKAWYQDVRKCLDSQHADGKTFEEEDFADMMNAALSPEATDFECQGDWDQQDAAKYITLKANDFDKVHSGTFYLMLMKAQIRRGSIPQSCLQALNDKGETAVPPKDCTKIVTSAADRD